MTITFNLSMPAELLKLVDKQAKRERRTRSEYLREAVRERLVLDQELKSIQRHGAAQAKKLGIRTEEDVYRLIQEFRKEQSPSRNKH